MTDWARSEAWFWRIMLPFCGGRTPCPDPDYCLPPWTLRGWTDAAGGTMGHQGYGLGGVIGEHWWVYLPWGRSINSGELYTDGGRLDCKMSAWELLAVLVLVSAGAELVRGNSLVVPVDNQGSVSIYQKGWCTSCMLSTTIAVALSEVAASLDCKLEVVKVRRCSTREAEAADAISKADWRRHRRLMPQSNHGLAMVPVTLSKWVEDPVEDRTLGERILRELGVRKSILGHHRSYC